MNVVIFIAFLVWLVWLSIRVVAIPHDEQRDHSALFMGREFTTILKGIAIILIIISHCSGHWMCGRLFTPCGGIGVSLFLITSGYGLNESYKSKGLNKFWRKRIGKVWLPYVVVTLAIAPVRWISWKSLGLQIFCIRSLYWFIPYILACYIVFWFSCKFCSRFRLTIISLVSLLSFMFLPELQAAQALGFVSGIWLSEYKSRVSALISNKRFLVTIIILFFAVGSGFLALKQTPLIRDYEGSIIYNFFQLLIKWPFSLSIIGIVYLMPTLCQTPFIYLTGTISYELYLVHFPFYTDIGSNLWPAILLVICSYTVSYYFNLINGIISNRIR